MTKTVHMLKLSVGTEDIAQLAAWQRQPRVQSADGLPRHVTRMWPKREAEILNGGSIYWVPDPCRSNPETRLPRLALPVGRRRTQRPAGKPPRRRILATRAIQSPRRNRRTL